MMAPRAPEIDVGFGLLDLRRNIPSQQSGILNHVVSRLSRRCNSRGAVRAPLAYHLLHEQGEAGRLRSRRKTWRVWQEAASYVPGHYEVCSGIGSWVYRPARRFAELQSVKWPLAKTFRVAFVPGGDEHHLRSPFHDLAGLELRASFAPSKRSAFLYIVQVHAEPGTGIRRSPLFLY